MARLTLDEIATKAAAYAEHLESVEELKGAMRIVAQNIREAEGSRALPRGEGKGAKAMEGKLREALADLCGLRETISDDVPAFDIGRHPETGEWRVWHEEYPEEGSMPLALAPAPSPQSGGEGARRAMRNAAEVLEEQAREAEGRLVGAETDPDCDDGTIAVLRREDAKWREPAEALRSALAPDSDARDPFGIEFVEKLKAEYESVNLPIAVNALERVLIALRMRAAPSAAPEPLAPWYEADGSTTMLPAAEVERRGKLAAQVIEAARFVVLTGEGISDLDAALDALDAPPSSTETGGRAPQAIRCSACKCGWEEGAYDPDCECPCHYDPRKRPPVEPVPAAPTPAKEAHAMMCYRDRTYCCGPCAAECSRQVTAEVTAGAECAGAPLAISDMRDTCPQYLPPGDAPAKGDDRHE